MSHLALHDTADSSEVITASICPRCGQPIACDDKPDYAINLQFPEADLMKLTEFYDAVSRRADMAKIQVGAADTRRVLSEAFMVLSRMNAVEAGNVIAQGLNKARAKATKAK